jgi:hypothetical protein
LSIAPLVSLLPLRALRDILAPEQDRCWLDGTMMVAMSTLFSVSDDTELNALVRALLESKFAITPADETVSASPFVAALAERAAHALRQTEASQDESWRLITPRAETWRIAVERAVAQRGFWRAASSTQRESYARALLSPYLVTLELVSLFCQTVDAAIGGGHWFSSWRKSGDPFLVHVLMPRADKEGDFVVMSMAREPLFQTQEERAAIDWLLSEGFIVDREFVRWDKLADGEVVLLP